MATKFFGIVEGGDPAATAELCLGTVGIRPRAIRLRARRLTRFHRERPVAIILRDRDATLVAALARQEGSTSLVMTAGPHARLIMDCIPDKRTKADDGRNHGLSASPMLVAAAASLGDEEATDE